MIREIAIIGKKTAELVEISRKYLLALSREEMDVVQAHFSRLGRNPTDIELEMIAQTWSEHCIHKVFRGVIEYEEDGRKEVIDNLLKSTLFRETKELNKPYCLSVFKDNAGVVEFDREYGVAFKVETHNHPSALEPYGGAETGIGGVIRDILGAGLGAKPILNTDVFCFGPLDYPYDKLPPSVLHPRRIYKGVVSGVRDYGNRMGIPTANGAILFDEGYLANPLVYCGTLGLIPRNKIEKEVKPGDLILVVGGRTGRDGIHGATFSSLSLQKGISASVVQIGAPITEKKFLDVLLVARDRNLFRSITDCGAGGLSSAVGELGSETGADVHLEQVPLKYAGLAPWEIWVSEAQERMVLAVPPENKEVIKALFASEGAEATFIGEFTGTGIFRLFYKEREAGNLTTSFLYDGLPRIRRKAIYRTPLFREPDLPLKPDYPTILKSLLSHHNIAGKEKVIRQYDHEVQGQTVLKPLVSFGGPSDAVVLKPLYTKGKKGIVVSNGVNLYGKLDPYLSAANAIDEALRNLAAVGGDIQNASLLDNFCWGDTGDPEILGGFVRAARACYEIGLGFGTPFISGKDSLNNYFVTEEGVRISIPPTLLISAVSVIRDVNRVVSMDLKGAGNFVYLLGETKGEELGGSHYLKILKRDGGRVPEVNVTQAKKRMVALHEAINSGLVLACHDLSEGGLAVSAAEMAFGGMTGLEIDLKQVIYSGSARSDAILFSESASRFLVEISPVNQTKFEKLFARRSFSCVGETLKKPVLKVKGLDRKTLISEDLKSLFRVWNDSLPW
ncbi:MAG: phosphoribosylformylglycinamidine synthase subunit PurL [Candidatus Ratteibacteria bacterium]|jgi:phosphoribosylformylglycinamidine synthase